MDSAFTAIEAPVVFAEVESTGKHAASTTMPLHEAVIARMRVEEFGESLIVRDGWATFANDVRVGTRSLGDEYARLQRNYGRDLLVAVYGQPHEGRLRKVMIRIHEAFLKGIKPSKIVDLGKPEGDFIDFSPAAQPAAPAIADALLGKDTDEAGKVDSSELAKINATATTPANVTEMGSEDIPEEAPIDGALLEFLIENGWNEPQAAALARVVRDVGIRSVSDADLIAVPGFRNADARRSVRQHLTEYQAQKKVLV